MAFRARDVERLQTLALRALDRRTVGLVPILLTCRAFLVGKEGEWINDESIVDRSLTYEIPAILNDRIHTKHYFLLHPAIFPTSSTHVSLPTSHDDHCTGLVRRSDLPPFMVFGIAE